VVRPAQRAAKSRHTVSRMLKAIAKKTIRKDHWAFLGWYRERFGTLPAVRAYMSLLRNKGMGHAPNSAMGGSVLLRPGTADQDVYDQIFRAREYDIDLGAPLFILDAGAHIGLSSVFFAGKYPQATVVAIEPEPSNFNLLLQNAKRYPNIAPIRAGLWSRKTRLRIQESDVDTWSFRVAEDPSGQGIPAVSIQDIMAEFGARQIDVLKLDIEGSEVEVLRHHQPWIDAVGTIIIELHDRFRPGCAAALASAVGGYDYETARSGESLVISKMRRPAA
jgi:FkbM family methyltransferase